MKKEVIVLGILVCFVAISCNKQKLKEGEYKGDFHGFLLDQNGLPSQNEQNDLNVLINFSDLTDTSVVVNDYYINPLQIKSNDSIFGVIAGTGGDYYVSPTIKGVISKSFGKIHIEGFYHAKNTASAQIEGTFEIKSL